jgi:hypothetical protein
MMDSFKKLQLAMDTLSTDPIKYELDLVENYLTVTYLKDQNGKLGLEHLGEPIFVRDSECTVTYRWEI